MNIIEAIGIGALSSLIASIVWLFAFSRIRPNIQISDKIAKTVDRNNETVYKIKVINRGKRPIMNVQAKFALAKFALATPRIVPNGFVIRIINIELQTHELFALAKFDKGDEEAEYAYRFLTYENLDEAWIDDKLSYLVFRIYATDSLSGLGKLFERKLRLKRSSIIEGDFEVGDSFEIA
jgi:hypothetical protein